MSELLWAGLMDLRWFYLFPSIGRIYFTYNDSIHDRNITNEKITHGRKLGTTECGNIQVRENRSKMQSYRNTTACFQFGRKRPFQFFVNSVFLIGL